VDTRAAEKAVAGILSEDSRALETVRSVTTLLPDTAYLVRLSADDSSLELQGFAASAGELIELFEASPDYAEARFEGPIVKDPRSGRERFTLKLLRSGAAR
ncbi:MAG: PilN domain-containing protein, partial [Pseudomonadota bacterium]